MNEPREHLEADELVDLCAALRWEPDRWLAHLGGCAECRESLRELDVLHGAFGSEEVPEPVLLRIQQALASAPGRAPASLPRAGWPAGIAAGVTATAALTVFAMINPLSAGAVLPAVAMGLAVGWAASRPSPRYGPLARLVAAL